MFSTGLARSVETIARASCGGYSEAMRVRRRPPGPPPLNCQWFFFRFRANASDWLASTRELGQVFLIHVSTEESSGLLPLRSKLALVQFNNRNMFVVREVADFGGVPQPTGQRMLEDRWDP